MLTLYNQECNTKENIARYLVSLAGLNKLRRDRHMAYSTYEQPLEEFWIMGRWRLDAWGNFCRATGKFIPKEQFPSIPDILTDKEFWAYLLAQGPDLKDAYIMTSLDDEIPLADVHCAECNRLWTIADCADALSTHKIEDIALNDFVGQTIGEVKAAYSFRSDAVYFMQNDILLRSDRFINPSPNPSYPTLQINERGYVGERDGVNDAYVIQPGDVGVFNVWRHYHTACNLKKLAHDEEKYFRNIFARAGYKKVKMTAIPNQYCPCERCAPWFLVNTPNGVFTIGWRKRVIVIDWSRIKNANLAKWLASKIFGQEDVTKGGNFIHAHGDDKAAEYLKTLRSWFTNPLTRKAI